MRNPYYDFIFVTSQALFYSIGRPGAHGVIEWRKKFGVISVRFCFEFQIPLPERRFAARDVVPSSMCLLPIRSQHRRKQSSPKGDHERLRHTIELVRETTTQPAQRRPVGSNDVSSPFSSPWLHWSLAGCTVIIVATVFFRVGRLVPMLGAAKGSAAVTATVAPDAPSSSITGSAPQKHPTATLNTENSIAMELEEIQKLEPEYQPVEGHGI